MKPEHLALVETVWPAFADAGNHPGFKGLYVAQHSLAFSPASGLAATCWLTIVNAPAYVSEGDPPEAACAIPPAYSEHILTAHARCQCWREQQCMSCGFRYSREHRSSHFTRCALCGANEYRTFPFEGVSNDHWEFPAPGKPGKWIVDRRPHEECWLPLAGK
jgi:hypothetical protein